MALLLNTSRIPFQQSRNHQSRQGQKIDMIVIHASGYGSNETWNDFKNDMCNPNGVAGSKGVAPQYAIGQNPGEIVQFVDDSEAAQHAAGFNTRSIGVELYNKDDNKEPYTGWQYTKVAELAASLA